MGFTFREDALLKRLLLMKQMPFSPDYALLWLRVGCFTTLFLKHGLQKLSHYPGNMHSFFDPLHIGPLPSLLFATLSDSICSLLIIAGLATRWSALVVFVNIFVAWAFQQHFLFFAHDAAHGELMVLYLVVSLMLFIGGAGRFSFDALLDRSAPDRR